MSVLSFIFLIGLSANLDFEVLKKAEPVPNQSVVLVSLQGQRIDEKKTNKQGRVRFQVDPSQHALVAAGTLFEGVAYISDPVATAEAPQRAQALLVFPSTEDKTDLFISDMNMYFEIEDGNLRVEQGFWVKNPSEKSIRASTDGSVFDLEVPGRAYDFKYEMGFRREEVKNEGNKISVTSPLYPGRHYFSFSYFVDSPRWRVSLAQKFSLSVARLSVLTNSKNLRIDSPELERTAQKYYSGGLREVYSGELGLQEFEVRLSGIPLNLPWQWYLPWLVCFFFIVLVLLLPDRNLDSRKKSNLSSLLEDWLYLQRLKRENQIDEKEYRMKKLSLVEELLPHFDSKGDEDSESQSQKKFV